MNLINLLKKISIDIEVVFNEKFIPKVSFDRKKLAFFCWKNINYTLCYQFFKGIAMVPFKWADSSCLEKKQIWWPRTQTVITKERTTPRRWSKEQKVVSQTMRWFSINNDMLIRYGWWARSRMHLLIKISFQFVF